MLFKDLKEGMRFRLYSEDNPEEFTEGAISEISRGKNTGHRLVQFNDENGVFTWGEDNPPVHEFMIQLDRE